MFNIKSASRYKILKSLAGGDTEIDLIFFGFTLLQQFDL